MKRNGISADSPYWPTSPAASTPSVISCYTPSNRGPPTPSEALGQSAIAMESPSNLDDGLKGHPYSHSFNSVQISSISELVESSFPSRDDFNNHTQLEHDDYEMKGYETEKFEDEDAMSQETHCGVSAPQYNEWTGVFGEEVTIWGFDLGFFDLDIGKNNDINAIKGGIPISESDWPSKLDTHMQYRTMSFAANGYYARPVPVPIRIPRSFEPLPSILLENPMNLLYFHHFISNTAKLLVSHDCVSNPFQSIFTKMAIEDERLMSVLLAYSASHRAQLLEQFKPIARIALWVKNIIPKLWHTLYDLNGNVSNTNIAISIMLASSEIILPNIFGGLRSWQKHLSFVRSMVLVIGTQPTYGKGSDVWRFLWRWFVYHDVLGSLIGGRAYPSPLFASVQSRLNTDHEMEFQIDCFFGFTSRCMNILALIAQLARECDIYRIDSNRNVRPEWVPSVETITIASKLIADLETARTNPQAQACSHLHSVGGSEHHWDIYEMTAINEAYHWAGLVYLYRRILGKTTEHVDVKTAVSEIIRAICKVSEGSTAEFHLLFPIFIAGCNAQFWEEQEFILDRIRGMEGLGMIQVHKARILMQKVWDTGKPFETLVSDEFFG